MIGTRVTRRAVSAGIALLALGFAAGIPQAQAQDAKKIVLLVNGNLGDRAFFDSGANGFAEIKAKYGDAVETKVIEMGYDQTKWLPTLEDVSEQGYDLVYTIWSGLYWNAIAPIHDPVFDQLGRHVVAGGEPVTTS